MALKTLVKVGSISSLSDARYCAGMGVEMLGFNLDPQSDTYVSPEYFKEITEWIAGVRFVGEFNGADTGTIKGIIGDYRLDLVQISEANPEIIFDFDLPVILKIESTDVKEIESRIKQFGDEVDYFLLEELKDMEMLDNLPSGLSILWGANQEAGNVIAMVKKGKIKGIALKGSVEEKPGFKDYDQLADMLEALEIED